MDPSLLTILPPSVCQYRPDRSSSYQILLLSDYILVQFVSPESIVYLHPHVPSYLCLDHTMTPSLQIYSHMFSFININIYSQQSIYSNTGFLDWILYCIHISIYSCMIHHKHFITIAPNHNLVKHPILWYLHVWIMLHCYSKLKLKWQRASQWTPSPCRSSAVVFVSTHYGVHLSIIETTWHFLYSK